MPLIFRSRLQRRSKAANIDATGGRGFACYFDVTNDLSAVGAVGYNFVVDVDTFVERGNTVNDQSVFDVRVAICSQRNRRSVHGQGVSPESLCSLTSPLLV